MLQLFLAPDGDDAHDGNQGQPWRSLATAIERLRDKPATLHVRGEHNLSEPLLLGPQHQGLTIQAWGDDAPILYSQIELPTRRRLPRANELPLAPGVGDHLWEIDLPPGPLPAAFFADGQAQPLARWPKSDCWEEWPDCAPGEGARELRIPIALQRRHPNLTDVTINYLSTPYTKWTNYLGRVQALEGESCTVSTFLVPNTFLKPTPTIPFRQENVLEALTAPGEWAVDTRAGKLWWWPPAGIDPTAVRLSVPRLDTIIRIIGTPTAPVTGIALRGLRFTGTNGPVGNAAVELVDAHRCTLAQCRFDELGGGGIKVSGDSRELTIQACELSEVGGAGIVCQGPRLASEHTAGRHLITGNRLRRCGQINWHAAAISLAGVSHCLVRDNRLEDLPYAGITIGGSRLIFILTNTTHGELKLPFPREEIASFDPISFKRYVSGHNRIEENRISDAMRQLDDGGAIYSHASHHNELRGNIVFRTGRASSHGLYFDDDETESLMEDNLVVDVPGLPGHGSAIHLHDNARNTLRRNLVLGSTRPFTFPSSYGGHHVSDNYFIMTASGQAPVPPKQAAGRYPQIVFDAGANTFDHNYYWSEDDGRRARQVLRRMSEAGYDLHSTVGDPGLRRDDNGAIILPDGTRLNLDSVNIKPLLQAVFARWRDAASTPGN